REGEFYVIDWTFPRWESVCIDLAWLLQTAPVPIRDRMINRYATQHPCSFHPGLPAADAHMAFCVAVNLIESALENGRDEKQRRHLDRLVLQLVNACDT
ncbi:MAG: hypothetical protein KF861_22365, partial [Planctomycetaceae bacterium]|nr:hypothetical protein [Planctomycetaceae bacterium]